MTPIKYLVDSRVGNSSEILSLRREHPEDFDVLVQWAREEMKHNGIEVTEAVSAK